MFYVIALADFTIDNMPQLEQGNQDDQSQQEQNDSEPKFDNENADEQTVNQEQQKDSSEQISNEQMIQKQKKKKKKKRYDQESSSSSSSEDEIDHDYQENEDGDPMDQNYLFFQAGEKLYIHVTYESGWWYGQSLATEEDPEVRYGFLPSNYVEKIEDEVVPAPIDQKEINNQEAMKQFTEQQEKAMLYQQTIDYNLYQQSNMASQNNQFMWMNYMSNMIEQPSYHTSHGQATGGSYAQQALQMQQQQEMMMPKNFEMGSKIPPTYETVMGYKKVKIANNAAILRNPNIIMAGEYALIPVRDQAPLSKAYRQLSHYFDYDRWNDNVNQTGVRPKGKADPKKKKLSKRRFELKLK